MQGAVKASAVATNGRTSSHLLSDLLSWEDCAGLVQHLPRRHNLIPVTDSTLIAVEEQTFQHLFRSSRSFCAFLIAAGDYVAKDLTGSYDFGYLKLYAGLYREEVHAATVSTANDWNLAVTVPIGVGLVKASYVSMNQNAAAGNNDGTLFALGYVHNLSKRAPPSMPPPAASTTRARAFYTTRPGPLRRPAARRRAMTWVFVTPSERGGTSHTNKRQSPR